jgi:hypothetical protein
MREREIEQPEVDALGDAALCQLFHGLTPNRAGACPIAFLSRRSASRFVRCG